MGALGAEIDAGVPIVVLEPSCAAVFHDELVNLFPDDERARRLSGQVYSLGAFLADRRDSLPAWKLQRRAVVHGHCHQKALTGMEGDRAVLDRLGIEYDMPDAGCCGMAGSFGFERDHYDVSMAIGERVLLPAIRRAPRDTLIVANGFSCREQIAQATDRRALHLADVLRMAMRAGPFGPAGDAPERDYVQSHEHEVAAGGLALGGIAALGTAATGVLLWRRQRTRAGRPRNATEE